MIITKSVKVRIQGPNIKYYKSIGYDDISIDDIIEVPISKLKKSSNVEIKYSCDECLIEKEGSYNFYNRCIKKSGKYLCKKCSYRERMITKYGVDHYSKTDEFKKKYRDTLDNKYGGHFNKLDSFKDKQFNTNKQKYGHGYLMQNVDIKAKKEETCQKLYGNKCVLKNEDILQKSINTMNSKYGHSYSMQVKSIKEKIVNSNIKSIKKRIMDRDINIIDIDYDNNSYQVFCDKCDNIFFITPHVYSLRKKYNIEVCTLCNCVGRSGMEIDLFNFIKQNYSGAIIENSRKIINGKEIDVYLPDLNLAFEFNGLYWHSEIYKEKKYHIDKTNMCKEKSIELVHIWEDDWFYKRDIVESMILNKLGKTSSRIYARKCKVIEIEDNKLIRDFLEKNHIQGFVGSKIKIGLFHDDELVSLMTFGSLRKSLGQISIDGSYELLRFCNKLNTIVVGGASKILSYFLNNFCVNEIISYSDLSRSDGNIYKKLGFNLEHISDPNYYYIVDGVRRHRFGFRKDRLVKDGADTSKTEVEIMNERGIYRIFDCGMQKFIKKI